MPGEIPGPRVENFTVRIPADFSRESVAELVGPYTVPENLPELALDAFEGKVALVTGSSRGIGEATARRLAEYGATVVVNSRESSQERAVAIVDSIIEQGGKAAYIPADITEPEHVRGLFKAIKKEFGKPDIVINNAGITRDGVVMRISEPNWDDVVATNLKGPFLVTKEAQRMMLREGGKLIYTSSLAAIGSPGQANYASAKAAMETLAQVTAREASIGGLPFDVGIFRIALVDTELTENFPEEERQKLIAVCPSQRVFTAEEAAVGITHLAALPSDGYIHRLTFA